MRIKTEARKNVLNDHGYKPLVSSEFRGLHRTMRVYYIKLRDRGRTAPMQESPRPSRLEAKILQMVYKIFVTSGPKIACEVCCYYLKHSMTHRAGADCETDIFFFFFQNFTAQGDNEQSAVSSVDCELWL